MSSSRYSRSNKLLQVELAVKCQRLGEVVQPLDRLTTVSYQYSLDKSRLPIIEDLCSAEVRPEVVSIKDGVQGVSDRK